MPRKNIAPLNGKPLIAYAIEAVLASQMVDDLVVSSEDDEILAVVGALAGARGVHALRRPPELALDTTPSLPVVQQAVRSLEQARGSLYDYVVMFQCTTPLMIAEDVAGALRLLMNRGADAVMSVFVTNDSHPAKAKQLGEDGRLTQYVPELQEVQFTRQKLQTVYRRNGAIYASKREVVMDQNKLYGGDDLITLGYVMPEERSVDVNSPMDLLLARALLAQSQSSNP